MSKLVLVPSTSDKTNALEVLDKLREAVEVGEVIGFTVVTVDDIDCTTAYASTTKPVTRLRMIGAVATLLHHFHTGDL